MSEPQSLSCAQYVRITDISNKADFPNDPAADGYDVDGVKATEGQDCTPVTPTLSPTPTATPSSTPTPTPVPTCRNSDGVEGPIPDGQQANSDGFCELIPTPTPSPVPNNPGGPGDGQSDHRSDGGSSCPSCTQSSGGGGSVLGASTDGQVLGASTDVLADTGTNEIAARIILATTVAGYIFFTFLRARKYT